MTLSRLLPISLITVVTVAALTGCGAINDTLHNETSLTFSSAADLEAGWDATATWLPADATGIRIHQSTQGDPAVLLATSSAELDSHLCVETERKSAATFTEDWAPDSYVDSVFACGDWAVIPTDQGWYGWTPNHPDEKAASLFNSAE